MGILDKLRSAAQVTRTPTPPSASKAVHETDPTTSRRRSAPSPRTMRTRASGARPWRASPTPRSLADIARNESDDGVREHAVGAAGGAGRASTTPALAVAGRDGAGVARPRARAGRRWPRRRDPRPCAARRSPAVRDQKALGSIARHAAEAGARLLAVERLTDPAEIEGVAMRGEHADAAVAAVDRLTRPSLDMLTASARRRGPRRRRRRLAR